jgi:putative protein-disulfide isomerase
MKPRIYYCFDAYCGWCYAFSPVILKIAGEFADRIEFEALSGGMIPETSAQHIGKIASFIKQAYPRVEEMSGVRFGEDFLWHINNPDKSDWFPHSEKSAIAMVIFKEYFPDRSIEFASDLQKSLNYEGRDLTDNEAYRHLLDKYGIPQDEFYQKLKAESYSEKAKYEFELVRQLRVTAFPAVLFQSGELKFHLLARGYTDHKTLVSRLEDVYADFSRNRLT